MKKHKLVVVDAALLIFWRWDKKVDLTILVNAGNKIKINRLVRKGLTEKEAKMRLKSQLSYAELKKYSDIVVLNNKSIESLELKVRKILKKITRKRLTLGN